MNGKENTMKNEDERTVWERVITDKEQTMNPHDMVKENKKVANGLSNGAYRLLSYLRCRGKVAANRTSNFIKAPSQFAFEDYNEDKSRKTVKVFENEDLRQLLRNGLCTVKGISGIGILEVTELGIYVWFQRTK
jgi:hypothetical protein